MRAVNGGITEQAQYNRRTQSSPRVDLAKVKDAVEHGAIGQLAQVNYHEDTDSSTSQSPAIDSNPEAA